jgi:hypothetical protein
MGKQLAGGGGWDLFLELWKVSRDFGEKDFCFGFAVMVTRQGFWGEGFL